MAGSFETLQTEKPKALAITIKCRVMPGDVPQTARLKEALKLLKRGYNILVDELHPEVLNDA